MAIKEDIILKDGGVLKIPDRTLKKWANIYPKVDIMVEIKILNENKIFNKLTKKGALKAINKRLMEVKE